jgi:hypothetical protein
MKIKRFTAMTLTSLVALLLVFPLASDTQAYQRGQGVRAGSVALTKPDYSGSSRRRKESKAKPDNREHSRQVVELLNLDFAFLVEAHKNAQKRNPALRFEETIKAALAAANQRPQAVEKTTHTLLMEMAKKKTLTEALQIVLHLSKAQAGEVVNAATAQLSQGKKQITEPQKH